MGVNNYEDFQSRVNYAAKVISEGRNTSRTFDSCFENSDGDEVATVLYRRSRNNPNLKARLWKYLCRRTCLEAVWKLRRVSTRQMPKVAAASRERSRIAFQKVLDEQAARQSAQVPQ